MYFLTFLIMSGVNHISQPADPTEQTGALSNLSVKIANNPVLSAAVGAMLTLLVVQGKVAGLMPSLVSPAAAAEMDDGRIPALPPNEYTALIKQVAQLVDSEAKA